MTRHQPSAAGGSPSGLPFNPFEQLSAVYGHDRATILQGNCDTQLYYRPNLLQTARYLEERLGMSSGYSRSTTLRHGEAASEALSERPIPLLASQDIGLMTDEEVIAWHRNYRPLKLKRMSTGGSILSLLPTTKYDAAESVAASSSQRGHIARTRTR